MKSKLQLILPLYFYRYQPAYKATLADTIMCAACSEHQDKLLSTYNTLPHLHEIDCPTLLLVGRHDFIFPPSQAQLIHTHIPQSRVVVFEHSGHLPWIEEPAPFSQTVKEWLEQAEDC